MCLAGGGRTRTKGSRSAYQAARWKDLWYPLMLSGSITYGVRRYAYYTAHEESATAITGQWAELFLVGSTLGAQRGATANVNLFNAAMNHLVGASRPELLRA